MMQELTINQKASVEINKINRALYAIGAGQGLTPVGFERLKYSADELTVVLSTIKTIRKSAIELEKLLVALQTQCAEIERASDERNTRIMTRYKVQPKKKKNANTHK